MTDYTTSTKITVDKTIGDFNSVSSFRSSFDNENGIYSDVFNINDEVQIFADSGFYPPATKIFSGVIEDVNFRGTETKEIVDISGRDFGAILQDIIVDARAFKDTEVSEIVLAIMSQNVGSSLITTNNVNTTTTTPGKLTFQNISVFDALKQLSELSGFFFYVDVDKDLHFEEKESASSGLTFGDIPLTDPLAHWKFNEANGSTSFVDSVGDANGVANDTYINFISGKINNSMEFVSSDAGAMPATISTTTALDAIGDTTNEYTVALWVKTSQTSANLARILEKAAGGKYPFIVRYGSNKKVMLALYDGSNNPTSQSANTITADTWTHYCWIINRTDSTIDLYVNGCFESTTVDDTIGDISTPAENIIMGNINSLTREFIGEIDDLRIYDEALTALGVKAIYNLGNGTEEQNPVYDYNVTTSNFVTSDKDVYNKVTVFGDRILSGHEQYFTANGGSVYGLDYQPHNLTVSLSGTTNTIYQPGGVINFNDPEREDIKYLVDFQGFKFIMTSGTIAGDNIPTSGSDTLFTQYQKNTPIISVKPDFESQVNYGVKDKVIADRKIKDPEEASVRAQAFLDEHKNPVIQGDLDVNGIVNVTPGETAIVNIPFHNIINQTYTIISASYSFTKENNLAENVLHVTLNKKAVDFSDTTKDVLLRLKQAEMSQVDAGLITLQVDAGSVGVREQWYATSRSIGSAFYFHVPNHNVFNSPSSLLGDMRTGSVVASGGF